MKVLLIIAIALSSVGVFAQNNEITQKLQSFNKIIVSPRIDLVLIPGETESIKIEYYGVEPENIIIDQAGKRVHVYLDHSKILDIGERRRDHDIFDRRERYKFAHVIAYVTFRNLKVIEARGESDVLCEGKISSKKLKIRAFGETDVRLAYLEAKTIKARLYGENTMKVLDGEAGHVSYKLYGENKIDTKGLRSITSSTTVYGDCRVKLNASEEVRVNSFGEPSLFVSGSPYISKGIILGHANIRSY
jgi:hypothetical protein